MNARDDELVRMLDHGSPSEQVLGLREMRDRISSSGNPRQFFDAAKRHVGSADNTVRWQSLIVVGEYICARYLNEEIWLLILAHCGGDEDMQNALATVLLEHLLEYDFSTTFTRVECEVRAGNESVVDLLERCWAFGEAETHWHQVDQLIQSYRGKPESDLH